MLLVYVHQDLESGRVVIELAEALGEANADQDLLPATQDYSQEAFVGQMQGFLVILALVVVVEQDEVAVGLRRVLADQQLQVPGSLLFLGLVAGSESEHQEIQHSQILVDPCEGLDVRTLVPCALDDNQQSLYRLAVISRLQVILRDTQSHFSPESQLWVVRRQDEAGLELLIGLRGAPTV